MRQAPCFGCPERTLDLKICLILLGSACCFLLDLERICSSRWFITGTPQSERWRCGRRARRAPAWPWRRGHEKSALTAFPRPASGARRSPSCTRWPSTPDASSWSPGRPPAPTWRHCRSLPCTPLASGTTRYMQIIPDINRDSHPESKKRNNLHT